MTAGRIHYAYGPVPSRRLGKSLGINNIPAKICSYSCIYCQVGRTTRMQNDRHLFFDPEDIFQDVRSQLEKATAASEPVDYLTFVPDGEPTLDMNLGKAIVRLKTLGVPVGVITNASLLWRENVREELCMADWISLKIDAVRENIWRRINRPHIYMAFACQGKIFSYRSEYCFFDLFRLLTGFPDKRLVAAGFCFQSRESKHKSGPKNRA